MVLLGPPINNADTRKRLCLYLLDQVRQNLPRKLAREVVNQIHDVERIIEKSRDPSFPPESIVDLTIKDEVGLWLAQYRFAMDGPPRYNAPCIAKVPYFPSDRMYSGLTVELRNVEPRVA